MKAKILLSALLSLNFYLLSSQVPQGFNYQAVARDGAGNPIANTTLQVKIGMLSDTIAPIIIWEELHSPVITDKYGLFSLVIGTGVRQAGSVTTFSDISWAETPLYLKTQVYYQNVWKYMGSARLWSVPYSMVAGDLIDTIKKLVVKGQTDVMDEALFEVKNKNGQTVFAVYNEGVRVYVDDGVAAKKAKGGFAIGGFDAIKAEGQKYFFIDPDSIRMYIDDNPLKKNKGGFAIGGFDQLKSGNTNFLNIATDESGIINPSQNRILWYPLRNAFLTGKVLIENPDSVGVNSFATGYESKAKGQYSQALGYQAIARGLYSTSIGFQSVASKDNSFAFGQWAQARNFESYAFGKGAIAEGFRSYAFGSAAVDSAGALTGVAYAKGDYSFALGQGSQTFGKGSFAFGIGDTAKGNWSTAFGYGTSAGGSGSTSMGYQTTASGMFATATGVYTKASGSEATAMGYHTTASGNYSTALGGNTMASGVNATALGSSTTASGNYSTALGAQTTASEFNSTAMGYLTTASANNSTAMGYFSTASGNYSTVIGVNATAPSAFETVIGRRNTDYTPASTTTWNTNDRLFVIGNGWSTKSDALTILKNGNVGIGTSSPTQKLDVNGNARFRSIGSGAYARVVNITSDGTLTTATSDIRSKENINTLSNSLNSVMNLRGVTFTWKSEPQMGNRIGLIAQEVEKVLPELIFTNPVDGIKGVNYAEMSAVFVEAIKEQQHKIESQQKQIDELRTQVNTLIANQTGKGNK
jgi:hypothetical protein